MLGRTLSTHSGGDVTAYLHRQDPHAREALMRLVHGKLRMLARRRMASERAHHTLQPTALVHEAYVRLARDEKQVWRDRRHFYGAMAEAMRRVLVDHARATRSQKRGGDQERVPLDPSAPAGSRDPDLLLAVNDALDVLAEEDGRAAEVVRLRFFGGLDVEETAQVLGVSVRTVMREWSFARARLAMLLGGT